MSNIAIEDILDMSAKALALEAGSPKPTLRAVWHSPLAKRYEEAETGIRTRRSRSIRNSFEGHYFYARSCFTQGKLEQAATLFAACRGN